ncbi:MAG TPA: pyridoxamine 5'-phosphate oxidase [Chryseolinea sp.]|nr:pyridoxamine 5'-phosphate oxidase [Chryseolinea sp.]HPM32460.1 pyridoxamine 5'-phosphate oxidase [Chryseolinea sp.]
MQKIDDLRKDYSKSDLDVKDVLKDPIDQFKKWFDEARKSEVPEVNAMNLSTVNSEGKPTSRIVLLKGIEEGKFIFYTNYQSQKGRELEQNPSCALNFFWPELERQVRIEGDAFRVDENKSVEYFQSRPRGSQIGAWSSPQSTIIDSRDILDERKKKIEEKFEGLSVLPKPHQWGGFEIDPIMFEFWQGRPSRLHDRVQYIKVDGVWKVQRLAP